MEAGKPMPPAGAEKAEVNQRPAAEVTARWPGAAPCRGASRLWMAEAEAWGCKALKSERKEP